MPDSPAAVPKVDDALMEAINQAFNARDVDRIMTFFAEDAVFATARGPHPWGQRYVGKQAIAEFLAARFERVSDMKWQHEYRYTCGDRAVSCWTVTGTTETGERIDLHGCDLYTFRDGKIVYKDTFWKSPER